MSDERRLFRFFVEFDPRDLFCVGQRDGRYACSALPRSRHGWRDIRLGVIAALYAVLSENLLRIRAESAAREPIVVNPVNSRD